MTASSLPAPPAPVQNLILVLGATASGKSQLAIELALRLSGEVISADAMAVYRGMDIGTAKPSAADCARVPHHLVSCLEPDDRCDVQRWLGLAEQARLGIAARGRIALVAGGSPLYAKALLEGLSAGAPRDAALRAELDAAWHRDAHALFTELQRIDPSYAAQRHANDRLRVVRALEVHRLTGRPYSSFHTTDGQRRHDLRTLLIGLTWDKEALHRRINSRCRALFAAGLVDEVRTLRDRLCREAAQAVGYKEVIEFLDGRCDLDTARERTARATRHLAKHQLTWYRRFRDIRWLPGDAPDLADQAEQLCRGWLPSTT